MRLILLLYALTHVQAVLDILTGLKMPRGLALDLQEGRMYWAEDGTMKLRSATLDGQDLRDVIVKTEVQEAPRDVAVDFTRRKVYWTALCCGLRRANLDGSDEEVVASAEFASGVAILNGSVFWADWMHGQIFRRDMGNSGTEEPIVTGLASPVDVAVDPQNQQIYWSDVGIARTQRASPDGSDIQVLNMSWAIMNTYGMAVDVQGRKLYMADFEKTGELTGSSSDYEGRIIRTNLDGSQAEVLINEPGMSMPYGIAVDSAAEQVYWTDQKAGRIQRLSLRCASGVLEVPSRMNSTMVQVEHGEAAHGSSIEVRCPTGYNGTVTLACRDSSFDLNRGKCGKRCPAGAQDFKPPGEDDLSYVVGYPEMDDREDVVSECPSPLVGTMRFYCQDGVVLARERQCRQARPCPEGDFLLDHAKVHHSEIYHGFMEASTCPDGFEGQYFLQCQDGEVITMYNSSCTASCDSAGSLWVDDGAVEVSHGKIIEGGKLKVVCPAGSAGEGVYLSCEDGYINVTESTCQRSSFCPGGSVLVSSAEILHDNLDNQEQVIVQCPGGFSGSIGLTCQKGMILTEGSCHKGCDQTFTNISGLQIELPGDLEHEMQWKLECPEGHSGELPFKCLDGNLTCPDCKCLPRELSTMAPVMPSVQVEISELPVAALAAAVTAVILLLCFAAGLLWHRAVRRKAMAAAVAAAMGDIPTHSVLPKSGTRSGRSAHSVSHSTSAASSGSKPKDEASFELVVDLPMALPLYWATNHGIHIFPDPNRIGEVQNLMTETWMSHYTRDRLLHCGGRVPVGCRVANVLRVENHKAYARYSSYKDALRMKRSQPCKRFTVRTSGKINLLDESVNEAYLFHGTNPESAQSICRDFFRMDRAGTSSGTMFGPGIYLAENASKSDEYAKEGSGVYVGLCAVLLCRCSMGEVLTVSQAGDMQERLRDGGYNSLCGDRLAAVGTYREMVFFNEEAVYPEFIVIYTRSFE